MLKVDSHGVPKSQIKLTKYGPVQSLANRFSLMQVTLQVCFYNLFLNKFRRFRPYMNITLSLYGYFKHNSDYIMFGGHKGIIIERQEVNGSGYLVYNI